MPKYIITIHTESRHSVRQMREIFHNMSADLEIEMTKLAIRKRNQPGRPAKVGEKVQIWLDGRTKPFTVKVFAKYLGITDSAAWKKLERLVRAGKMTKRRLENGSVEYQVYRPD